MPKKNGNSFFTDNYVCQEGQFEYMKQATLKIMALVQNHVLGEHVHFSFSICKQPI